jgi:2-iminobutanoate/2-iminopropanoate deaminase
MNQQQIRTLALAFGSFFLGMILMSVIFPQMHIPQKEIIYTNDSPKPIGPYSQAIRVDNLVFTSGQIGLDPLTNTVPEGIENQTEKAMTNIRNILLHSGADYADVVNTRIYLTNLSDFTTVNNIYARYMGSSSPARSTIQVSALPKGALIEIEMIAYRS